MSINCVGTGASSEISQFEADCTGAEYVGAAVYLLTDNSVRNALASDMEKADVIGLIVKKTSPAKCVVRKGGRYKWNSLLPGDYYLSATNPGEVVKNPPAGSVVLTRVGFAINSSDFYILPLILGVRR